MSRSDITMPELLLGAICFGATRSCEDRGRAEEHSQPATERKTVESGTDVGSKASKSSFPRRSR
jgi:hypothetical protein